MITRVLVYAKRGVKIKIGRNEFLLPAGNHVGIKNPTQDFVWRLREFRHHGYVSLWFTVVKEKQLHNWKKEGF